MVVLPTCPDSQESDCTELSQVEGRHLATQIGSLHWGQSVAGTQTSDEALENLLAPGEQSTLIHSDQDVLDLAVEALSLRLRVILKEQDVLESEIASDVGAQYEFLGHTHSISILSNLRGSKRIYLLCHELVHAAQIEKHGWDKFYRTYPKKPSGYWDCWQEKQARKMGAKLCSIICRQLEGES